jgi:broad specificity phosphatase PhoE
MDIFLVRHGEAAASWGQSSDPGLSELGVQQAAQAAQSLCDVVGVDIQLVSSPLARALETAAPLADMLALPVQVDDAYREIPSPVALAQRQSWLRGFMQQHWHEQPDSLCDWRDTALEHLQAMQHPAVVFTHFLVLNAIVGHLQQRSETLCFWPDNASITRLRLTGAGLELVSMGQEMETIVN